MRTVKLVIEYDGTELSGWQRQDNGPTVQEHLETALETLVGEPTPVVGASRTDAGVHALGQVAHFRTERTIPVHGIRRGLNSHLPEAIAVVAASEERSDFHARFDARGKHYCYQILCRQDRSPLRRHRVWHVPRAVDTAAMTEAAGLLVGEHDFSAFRATGCSAKTTRREVFAVDIRSEGDLVTIDVLGNAFLRNMVRIIAGTLVDIGQGRMEPVVIKDLLVNGRREDGGRTAPAGGLTLVRVFHGAESVSFSGPRR